MRFHGDSSEDSPDDPVIPRRWPSAWPYLSHGVYKRAAFVAVTAVLTAVGIAATGDLTVQWWIPLLPAVLLVGPVLRPVRLRRRLERAAAGRNLAVMPGRVHPGPVTSQGQTVRLVTAAGDAVGVPAFRGVAEALAVRHVGESVLLVWVPRLVGRAPAALILGDSLVTYLVHLPRGARSVTIPVRLGESEPALVPPRR